MRLIDLSQPVFDNCPNCPAHPPIRSTLIASHARDGWQVETLSITPHGGTHLDAPLHKIDGGASIDQIPLESFVNEAYVVDLRGAAKNSEIGPDMLAAKLPAMLEHAVVLIATGWGDKRARTPEWLQEAPALSSAGARWLVEKKVRGVGIDHYSISCREPENTRVHEILLGDANPVWIMEELHFPEAAFACPRPSTLWSLPINLKGHSGAFCRPVLIAG